jgi:hypothetical protein
MSKLEFYPNLTPRQVIEAGAFGGCYFGFPIEEYTNYDYNSLFEYHFKDIPVEYYLGEKYKPKHNKWGVRSGMDYEYWKDMGWMHEDDPYGWFEWWCKYDMGRRHEDDDRQIARWQDFCGRGGRWRNNIYYQLYKADKNDWGKTGEWHVSPRIQQSLLHWGYEINEHDYELWKNWRDLK